MAEQGGNTGNTHTSPPAPLPEFKHSSLPFPPPKPPVIHPILDNKKKPNPFAPKVPKNRVEKPKHAEHEVNKGDTVEVLNTSAQVSDTTVEKPQAPPQKVVEKLPEAPVERKHSEVKAEEVEKKIIEPEPYSEIQPEQHVVQSVHEEVQHDATNIIAEPDTETKVEEVKKDEMKQQKTEQKEVEAKQNVTAEQAKVPLGDDRIDMSAGLMGWISKTMTESKILSDVASKARYGMEQVIITLDPGMKGFLARDGVVDLYTAVEDHTQIRAVQEGFEKVFANVLVRNVPAAKGNLPETVYGSPYSLQICRQRADRIIQSRLVPADAVVLVFQPFIFHLDDKLYASTRLFLKWNNNEFDSLSQLLDVDNSILEVLKARSVMEGMSTNDFPISLFTAAQEVYAIKEESWTGPPPPFNSAELLMPAASLVALNFMNSSLKSNK
ncbi:unnamed protein product [Auanema sp. JU1783]|nr:unnamed protein product [Auanema sp. JU1783]